MAKKQRTERNGISAQVEQEVSGSQRMEEVIRSVGTTHLKRTSITLTDQQEALVRKMCAFHLAGSVSEYIAGLVTLDALMNSGKAIPQAMPLAWTLRAYPLAFVREARGLLLKSRKLVIERGQRFKEFLNQDGNVDLTTKDAPSFTGEE